MDKDDDSSNRDSSDSCPDEKKRTPEKATEGNAKSESESASKSKGPGKITTINSKDLKNVALAVQRDGTISKPNSPSKLPVASFRVLSDTEYEAEDAPKRKTAYYRYIERPADELAEEVRLIRVRPVAYYAL